MLRIDVPVWVNAVCYLSVTVKGKTVKVLLLVFIEPSMIVVAFPSADWNGAGVAHEGGDGC